MFLIEPFIWMFSVKNFKHHFVYLLLVPAVCWSVAALLFIGASNVSIIDNPILKILMLILGFVSIIIPILCLSGYFWCLTDNIIDRSLEAKLDSVYNGKTDVSTVIYLPDWDIFRFIWRGIASIVATIVMYIPFAIFMFLEIFNLSLLATLYQLNSQQIFISTVIFFLLFCFLLPGLFWNYARRDSVVAMLNIPKALYLMESYPGKYFFNSFMIVVISIARSLILRVLLIAFGLGAAFTYQTAPASLADILNQGFITAYISVVIIGYVIDTYLVYVTAYLLGTIAPSSEY